MSPTNPPLEPGTRCALARRLLPDVRIQLAHGQMRATELEEAMELFGEGHADVLLCTTIVESGLDMPRVNTIIVEDVHMFGLASLYQLRGRVGRNDLQASTPSHAITPFDVPLSHQRAATPVPTGVAAFDPSAARCHSH